MRKGDPWKRNHLYIYLYIYLSLSLRPLRNSPKLISATVTHTNLKKKKTLCKKEKEAVFEIFANESLLTFPVSAVWSSFYCNIFLWRLRLPAINLWRRVTNRSVAAIIWMYMAVRSCQSMTVQWAIKGNTAYFVKKKCFKETRYKALHYQKKRNNIKLKALPHGANKSLCLFLFFTFYTKTAYALFSTI